MSSIIPTVMVVDPDCQGGFRIINECDLQDADQIFEPVVLEVEAQTEITAKPTGKKKADAAADTEPKP